MAIQQKDIKLLWGRSGNRCAICKCELTQDKNAISSSFTLGEQAHIVGEKDNGPRGQSLLSLDERNNYHNLILLCPTHHREIDKNIEDYQIEKLHQIKSKHELWVTEALAYSTPVNTMPQTILNNLIEDTIELCGLNYWFEWTSYALAPTPAWDIKLVENIYKFRQKIFSYIWNEEHVEFKNTIIIFSNLLSDAVTTFEQNSQQSGNWLQAYKFYQTGDWNPNYDKDIKQYDLWINDCYQKIFEATKAINWLADIIRNTIDSNFFISKGKFLIQTAQYFDHETNTIKQNTHLLEYTKEEKQNLYIQYGLNS